MIVKIIYRPISFNSSGQLYKAKLLLATFDIPYVMSTPTFNASNSSSFTQSFSRNLESETNHDLEFQDSQFSQRLQRSQTRPRQKTAIERVESSQHHIQESQHHIQESQHHIQESQHHIQESQHHHRSTPTQRLIPFRSSPSLSTLTQQLIPSRFSPPLLIQAEQIDERTVAQIIEGLDTLIDDGNDIELDSTEDNNYFFRQVNLNNDTNEFILASDTDTDTDTGEEERS